MLQRISKREAFKRFCQGEPITLCPCKFRPEGPFTLAFTIHPREWLDHAQMLAYDQRLTREQLEREAWESMYRNWAWCNASYETGYYAHYYIEVN